MFEKLSMSDDLEFGSSRRMIAPLPQYGARPKVSGVSNSNSR